MIDFYLQLAAVLFFGVAMAGYPCCCSCCCPHCAPCFSRASYEFTLSAAPDYDVGSDCCDNQTACDVFASTFTLDHMGTYTACSGDYTACAYWQSAPFEVDCNDDGTNPHDAIALMLLYYQPTADTCYYLLAIAPARILENTPCNLTTLCRPDCIDDVEEMYAVYQKQFNTTLDCQDMTLDLVCYGNYCTDWPLTVNVFKP